MIPYWLYGYAIVEHTVQLDMSEGQKSYLAIHQYSPAGTLSSSNNSLYTHALQDLISDSRSKPAVVTLSIIL